LNSRNKDMQDYIEDLMEEVTLEEIESLDEYELGLDDCSYL
jgi:hypothetical protein